jgi:hypothetical protein
MCGDESPKNTFRVMIVQKMKKKNNSVFGEVYMLWLICSCKCNVCFDIDPGGELGGASIFKLFFWADATLTVSCWPSDE